MLRLLSSFKGRYPARFPWVRFLLAGLVILIISAMGSSRAGKSAQSIVIEDAFGRQISVNMPVQSIVVLNSDVLEVLRSLGAQDLVKGVYSEITKDGAFFKEFWDRPRVGSWKNANAELIADLNPLIVIAYENNPGTELEKQLSPFGIQVLRLNFYKLGTIAKEIKTLGKIIGREQQAETLGAWYDKKLDVIFKTTAWGNGFGRKDRRFFNNVRDEIAARPSWNLIQAVKIGRVHVLDSGIWTGPRAVVGVAYMAKCIYPRLFDDLDPELIHKEYLESFQKIPYQGVYISENLSGESK